MPANYVLLEKITVGAAGASSVTFSGIPQTGYTDLIVNVSARSNAVDTEEWMKLEFNGSGGTAYSSRLAYGNGSGAYSATEAGVAANTYGAMNNAANSTSSTFTNCEIYIPNYASSNYKSFSSTIAEEQNATKAFNAMNAGLWANTSAITSIKLTPSTAGTLVQYSTFYLYGVAKLGTTPAIVPYATGGDTIMTDGTYWYHTFLSSGTFTPTKGITCDYLVVAGGGSGASTASGNDGGGGGGGAGGLRSTVTATGGGGSLESALSLIAQAYTVTVGAGGASPTTGQQGGNGSNSTFSTITSTGGGGGGYYANGSNGGSGGGGGWNNTSGGTRVVGQGFAGGASPGAGDTGLGGGGGAGAVGASGSGSNGGNGGAGVATSITGSSVTYAGGGGGARGYALGVGTDGSGGSGGGGAGKWNADATAGTANTGSGGGGCSSSTAGVDRGGAGGSGIVIVRYAV